MIEIKGLKKSFEGHMVLNDIQMSIEPGKIYGLVGSNGCGKTTLLKHIVSIYKADAGEIFYNDELIKPNDIENIYYVQDDLFFPHNYTLNDLFVYEKMMYKNMSEKKFLQLKEFFKMDGNKNLRSLSKGQKKQAAFILAVAALTPVLLLDEIVDGLDAVVRKKFWKVIMSEVMDRDLTLLISSHALTELDNICDRVGILHDGHIIKEESIETMKEEVKRIQFAVKENFEGLKSTEFELIKDTHIGKVHFVVVKGDIEAFEMKLKEHYDVLLFEVLMMNLEEIFIAELGGLGYGNEEYITD